MRNKYPGECYRCKEWVAAGAGHFERLGRTWRVQHAECAIQWRGTPDAARQADSERRLQYRATKTGPSGQLARKQLREREAAQEGQTCE